jgi:DNA mismatch repair protein MutL
VSRRAIQQLPPDLVNRIAAGEVIERPASVVKELVENALDAGAQRVTVEIEDGGRSLIRVIDDGAGIPARELPLAFAPHATSKLRDDAELSAISTMGFRGEALASIGSVSRARILSRCGEDLAHEIRNDGGRITDVIAAAGNAGTTLEVRDLFFNTPARRKFLKGSAAESGQVTDMLVRLALSRPDVAFRYIRDGRVVSDWPAMQRPEDATDRLLIAWPGEYARAFRERPMPLDITDQRDGITWHLGGILGLPEFAATAGRYQHIYVNGRAVKDRSASHALREAYRGLTEPGRHPAAILLLTVPPGEVDVNVHPTKAEVRFRNAGRLWSLIHSAVREALLANDLAPRAQPSTGPPRWSMPREDVRHTLASFFKDALGQAQQTLELGAPLAPEATGDDAEERLAAGLPVSAGAAVMNASRPGEERSAVPTGQSAGAFAVETRPAGVVSDRHEETALDMPARSVNGGAEGLFRAIQLHNSYLVVQSDEGMEIIDQHALHERILYEELLARLRRGPLESQRMLIPVTFDAPEAHAALLEELAPTLRRLGIEAEPFGPGVMAVHAFPSFLGRLDPAAFLRDVLDRAETDLRSAAGNDEAILHEVLDMMACKAAIKAGDPLTAAEVEALVARRGLTARASNCPHGRPTTLRLSLEDLERQFKRTGF